MTNEASPGKSLCSECKTSQNGICFKHKIRTLSFGTVPGAYKATNSRSNYDAEALPNFPSKEEVQDMRSDFRKAPVKEIKARDLPRP